MAIEFQVLHPVVEGEPQSLSKQNGLSEDQLKDIEAIAFDNAIKHWNHIAMEQRLKINLTFIPRHCRNDKLLWEHYETVKESHGPLDFTLTLQKLKMMIL